MSHVAWTGKELKLITPEEKKRMEEEKAKKLEPVKGEIQYKPTKPNLPPGTYVT